MTPEIETLRTKHLPDVLADAAVKFIETEDPSIPLGIGNLQQNIWYANAVGRALIRDLPWNENTRRLLRFFIHISNAPQQPNGANHEYLDGVMRHLLDQDTTIDSIRSEDVLNEVNGLHRNLTNFVDRFLSSHTGLEDWRLAEQMNPKQPFIRPAANFLFQFITPAHAKHPELFTGHPGLLSALAIYVPEVARAWAVKSPTFESWERRDGWPAILDATDQFDQLCLSFAEAVAATDADDACAVVNHLNQVRDGAYLEILLHYAAMPDAAINLDALENLLKHREAQVIGIMTRTFATEDAGENGLHLASPAYQQLFLLIVQRWNEGGGE